MHKPASNKTLTKQRTDGQTGPDLTEPNPTERERTRPNHTNTGNNVPNKQTNEQTRTPQHKRDHCDNTKSTAENCRVYNGRSCSLIIKDIDNLYTPNPCTS